MATETATGASARPASASTENFTWLTAEVVASQLAASLAKEAERRAVDYCGEAGTSITPAWRTSIVRWIREVCSPPRAPGPTWTRPTRIRGLLERCVRVEAPMACCGCHDILLLPRTGGGSPLASQCRDASPREARAPGAHARAMRDLSLEDHTQPRVCVNVWSPLWVRAWPSSRERGRDAAD